MNKEPNQPPEEGSLAAGHSLEQPRSAVRERSRVRAEPRATARAGPQAEGGGGGRAGDRNILELDRGGGHAGCH